MGEVIYAVHDFHDGPIEGVANFEGHPHHFKCQFNDDEDEYSDVYCLTPISTATLRLVLESWQIFCRWSAAFHAGETSLDTHPALPNERLRYNDLKEAIGRAMHETQNEPLWARAQFLPDETVKWTRVSPAAEN